MATDPKERPSQICIKGRYLRNIKELAQEAFGASFRIVNVEGIGTKNRYFQILLVDAPDEKVNTFLKKYSMCKIENIISKKK